MRGRDKDMMVSCKFAEEENTYGDFVCSFCYGGYRSRKTNG